MTSAPQKRKKEKKVVAFSAPGNGKEDDPSDYWIVWKCGYRRNPAAFEGKSFREHSPWPHGRVRESDLDA